MISALIVLATSAFQADPEIQALVDAINGAIPERASVVQQVLPKPQTTPNGSVPPLPPGTKYRDPNKIYRYPNSPSNGSYQGRTFNLGEEHGLFLPSRNPVINKDPEVYAHALKEAQMVAAQGKNYSVGHPLGTHPSCKHSGTGWSRSPHRPGHCYEDELPESRIVARARVYNNGIWFWAAQYR